MATIAKALGSNEILDGELTVFELEATQFALAYNILEAMRHGAEADENQERALELAKERDSRTSFDASRGPIRIELRSNGERQDVLQALLVGLAHATSKEINALSVGYSLTPNMTFSEIGSTKGSEEWMYYSNRAGVLRYQTREFISTLAIDNMPQIDTRTALKTGLVEYARHSEYREVLDMRAETHSDFELQACAVYFKDDFETVMV